MINKVHLNKDQKNLLNASSFSWANHSIRWPDLTRNQPTACIQHRSPVPTSEDTRPAFPQFWQLPGRRRAAAWTTLCHTGRSVCVQSWMLTSGAIAVMVSPQNPYQCNRYTSWLYKQCIQRFQIVSVWKQVIRTSWHHGQSSLHLNS